MTKKKSNLGDTLIKSRNKRLGRTFNEQTIGMFTTDIDPKEERRKLYSNTDIGNNLENFLEITSLEQKVFESEKQNVVVITKTSSTVLSKEEKEQKTLDHQKLMEKHRLFWNSLTIPRRPSWNENTTTEELLELEKEVFYHWRKGIAKLEEEQGLLVTPFEKNAEVWKQLWRVAERSDLLVQIVDCRNPLLFRCPDLEKYVKEINPNKVNLLLVNKADLLTKLQRKKWAKYFESEGVNFRFFSAHKEQVRIEKQKQLNRLIEEGSIDPEIVEMEERKRKELLEQQNESEEDRKIKIFDREEILEEFLKLQPKPLQDNRYNNRVVVGLAGYPNVGKSSTINVLYGEKKVAVAPTPGKTKYVQTIILDEEIVLLDCPGLVFPTLSTSKADLVCNGLLPIDQLRDFISPVDLICERLPRTHLEEFYSIGIPKPKEHEPQDRAPTAAEFLSAYGYMRGFRTVHGAPDQSRAARIVLKDFVNGKLLYCHPPPGFDAVKFQRKTIKGGKNINQDEDSNATETMTTTTTTSTTSSSSTANFVTGSFDGDNTMTATGKKVTYDYNKDNEAALNYQDNVRALTKDAKKKKKKIINLEREHSNNSNNKGDAYTRTQFHHSTTPEAARMEQLSLKEKEQNSKQRLEQIRALKQQILQQQQQQQQTQPKSE
ncbi:hypothetical protein DICPUDRAFT_76802 [Dictyostelium purpureum]|uniref:CP-type G domain-containing protein n=1 Tax=Dictyostelium purpureum TaxID=5786 RepID=F0ZEP0_DICPU|nr:uncharacterized protein DICPUDRAFT_76802 [Dictyostelium purpureum]EGC37624.1 hypothetical protein DICPUDRAFT_76802 [Dictyostelium purpureum]|eukprot:XP_003285885.1 hypothetical protein DICPUDRAFT_76802 [Dictyostelium purpureum]